jgi:hypothetical protein
MIISIAKRSPTFIKLICVNNKLLIIAIYETSTIELKYILYNLNYLMN